MLAIGIGEGLGVAFVDANFPRTAGAPVGLRRSVVDFDRVTLDDHAQVATREVHVLAVAVRQELDRRAILPGDVYGDDKVPVSDAALMLVRADDELIVATRNAVPERCPQFERRQRRPT